jgi:hypothetical protein
MRTGKLLALAGVLVGAAAAAAQTPEAGPPPPTPPPPGLAEPIAPPDVLPVPTHSDRDLLPQGLSEPFAERFWFTADYLLWWNKDNHLPPLLATGSVTDTHPGSLGQPGTQVLYGGAIDSGERSGGRFSAGLWFTGDHLIGMDSSFFFLGQRSTPFAIDSQAEPLLTLPFFGANGQALAFGLASPGGRTATYAADVSNRFWGADINARSALYQDCCLQWAVLAGFRYLDLSEALNTQAVAFARPQSQHPGSVVIETDQTFGTRNYFYGGQLGSELTALVGRWSVGLSGKVALGATHEIALINGSSLVPNTQNQLIPIPVSELVGPSNAGRYSRDMFTVVPEVGVNLGYEVTSHVRLTLGYDFLYMSNAVRPGDLIDTTINVSRLRAAIGLGQAGGPVRPVFSGNATDFWAQGISAGLEFHY